VFIFVSPSLHQTHRMASDARVSNTSSFVYAPAPTRVAAAHPILGLEQSPGHAARPTAVSSSASPWGGPLPHSISVNSTSCVNSTSSTTSVGAHNHNVLSSSSAPIDEGRRSLSRSANLSPSHPDEFLAAVVAAGGYTPAPPQHVAQVRAGTDRLRESVPPPAQAGLAATSDVPDTAPGDHRSGGTQFGVAGVPLSRPLSSPPKTYGGVATAGSSWGATFPVGHDSSDRAVSAAPFRRPRPVSMPVNVPSRGMPSSLERRGDHPHFLGLMGGALGGSDEPLHDTVHRHESDYPVPRSRSADVVHVGDGDEWGGLRQRYIPSAPPAALPSTWRRDDGEYGAGDSWTHASAPRAPVTSGSTGWGTQQQPQQPQQPQQQQQQQAPRTAPPPPPPPPPHRESSPAHTSAVPSQRTTITAQKQRLSHGDRHFVVSQPLPPGAAAPQEKPRPGSRSVPTATAAVAYMTHDTPTAAAAAHLQDVQRQVRLLELRQSHHGFAPPPPAGGGMVVGAPHVLGAPGLPVTHPLHAAAAAAAAAAYAGLPYVQPAPAPTMAGQYASQTYGYTFPDYDAPPPYATHGSYIHPSMVSHHHPGAAGGPYAHMQPEVPTVA